MILTPVIFRRTKIAGHSLIQHSSHAYYVLKCQGYKDNKPWCPDSEDSELGRQTHKQVIIMCNTEGSDGDICTQGVWEPREGCTYQKPRERYTHQIPREQLRPAGEEDTAGFKEELETSPNEGGVLSRRNGTVYLKRW